MRSTLGRLAASLFCATTALPALAHDVEDHPPIDDAIGAALSLEITLDVVSQYFFRGYEQQDSGFIFQPGATIGVPITDGVGAYFGVWESFHSVSTMGAPTGPKSWYEQDVYAGVTIELTDILTLDLNYTGYFSPSDSFSDIHEIGVGLAMADTGQFGEDVTFEPHVFVAFEVQDNGGTEDTYLELGGTFGFDINEDISASVPVVVGLSLDDYYTDATGDNEVFGYASVGFFVTVPMSVILDSEEWVGAWDLTAGVTVLFLNDDAGLTDDVTGSSDEFQVFGSIGLSREW
ncbi:hypothetical protein OT109_17735 [Phycisphaeraceae bacterium D3-23]